MITTLLILLFFNIYPYTISGNAVSIKDGDTFVLLTGDRTTITIRLEGVDAPEKGQDFHNASKTHLGELLKNMLLTVKVVGKDRYGRLIGRVMVAGNFDVSLAMIRSGMAWHFKKYSAETLLADAEISARIKKAGLWQLQHPTPPWEFRHRKKTTAPGRSSGKQVAQVFFGERPHQSVIVSDQGIRQRPFALL